jgi:hypothetical protein
MPSIQIRPRQRCRRPASRHRFNTVIVDPD